MFCVVRTKILKTKMAGDSGSSSGKPAETSRKRLLWNTAQPGRGAPTHPPSVLSELLDVLGAGAGAKKFQPHGFLPVRSETGFSEQICGRWG